MLFEGRTKEQEQLLRRARRPFMARNIATGLALFGFAAAVYTYSLVAVKQENFDDIVVPDTKDKNSPSPSAPQGQ
ncbi:hypothetical protein H4R33_000823 [Dimargaris cristalligena]|nr:hypothetical protein H4R33_000823 [Dimargaris cristalligena]